MKIRKRKPIGKTTVKYIEQLYMLYSRKLFYIARNYVKDIDLAEDVLQGVFEKALLYPNSILKVPEDEILYFLTAMTKNTALAVIQDEKNNEHESLTYDDGDEGDFVEDPRNNYLQMIDLESLKQKLAAMPDRNRDTLLFRYVYRFKCKEIADLFQISERSVKLRCSDARKQLKKMLEEDGEYFDS